MIIQLKWLGHCAFLITSESGVRIITDPYDTAGRLQYKDIDEAADVVTVTHDHFDHNNVKAIRGNPVVVTTNTTTAKGIEFKAIPSYHDDVQGQEMGLNTVIRFTVDGVRLCHLGDLGQGKLTPKHRCRKGYRYLRTA
jgi:L-ascorbate metabolism protein UlaG (beta-lactamase superfamily)